MLESGLAFVAQIAVAKDSMINVKVSRAQSRGCCWFHVLFMVLGLIFETWGEC